MLKVIELFGGIGAPHKALQRLGIPYEIVDMVEFDEKVVQLYNIIHHTDFKAQNVLEWDKDVTCDYLHASTPCQAFSYAGKNLGVNDHRGAPLWDATIRIIMKTKPKFITLENVKGLTQDKHKPLLDWYLTQLDNLGYVSKVYIYNAKDFGVPQSRERVFVVSHLKTFGDVNIPTPNYESKVLRDILEPNVKWLESSESITTSDGNMYFENKLSTYTGNVIELNKEPKPSRNGVVRVATLKSTKFQELKESLDTEVKPLAFNQDSVWISPDGVSNTLTTTNAQFKNKLLVMDNVFNQSKNFLGLDGCSNTLRSSPYTTYENKIIEKQANKIYYRELTALECMRLTDFNDVDYMKLNIHKINRSRIIKACGNSIVVACIQHIIKHLIKEVM